MWAGVLPLVGLTTLDCWSVRDQTQNRPFRSGVGQPSLQDYYGLPKQKNTFKKVRKRMTFYPVFPTWGEETGDDDGDGDDDESK